MLGPTAGGSFPVRGSLTLPLTRFVLHGELDLAGEFFRTLESADPSLMLGPTFRMIPAAFPRFAASHNCVTVARNPPFASGQSGHWTV